MKAQPFVIEAATDKLYLNKLSLMYIQSKLDANGYDFYGVSWEQNIQGKWVNRVFMLEKEFDNGTHRKFITNIHSINEKGEAIVKIGESNNPRESMSCTINYSWRKWDLLKNLELEYLKSCIDPFEKYEDPFS